MMQISAKTLPKIEYTETETRLNIPLVDLFATWIADNVGIPMGEVVCEIHAEDHSDVAFLRVKIRGREYDKRVSRVQSSLKMAEELATACAEFIEQEKMISALGG